MNSLAIDTSSEYLSLALSANGQRYHILEQVGNKQSKYIIEKIDTILNMAKISSADLNLIAYIEGPGSFTSLRVGLSVALGISFGVNAKLVAIPTFALYAKASGINGKVLIGIDARLNQIYLAGIDTATYDYFIEPQVIDPDQITLDSDCVLIGNGFSVYKELLTKKIQSLKWIDIAYPKAESMLDLLELNKYSAIPPSSANLVYLRNKVAMSLEEQRQNKPV